MRFVLFDKKNEVFDEIYLPDDLPIKEAIPIDSRIFIKGEVVLTSNKKVDTYYFYERDSYNWLEEIELKRIKH